MKLVDVFDVLDEYGNPTGVVKRRDEVHRDGDWHHSVHIWIANPRGEVLLQKRAADKDTGSGAWDISAAGHIMAGSTPVETAVREIEEELGIAIAPEEFEHLFTIKRMMVHNDGAILDNEFNHVYLLMRDLHAPSLVLQTEELDEVRFVPFEKIHTLMDVNDSRFSLHNQEYRKQLTEAFKKRFK